MKTMKEDFVPRLNEFTEMLKETYSLHAENIRRLGDWQKELADQAEMVKNELREMYQVHQPRHSSAVTTLAQQLAYTNAFKEAAREERSAFQQLVQQTNEHLGRLSSFWGSHIEALGVQHMLNTLKKHYGVHTSIQKFKRWWHKSRNVEVDLLAVSDTTAYIVEVKNQLKEDTFKQMLAVLDKIKEKVPEYAHLKMQPVFVCVHAEEKVVQTTLMSGLWIIRYCGFDTENAKEKFVWLRKDEEPIHMLG
ncbi:MAG: hypothetical protein JNM88_02030 [Chitinophagaceae bacterium]|nr:hypothetical protein [Chitinophagaceae bacterium]